jgi:hypothetical protein
MPQTKPIPIEDANKLTQLCFDFYERSLTKNGKPTVNEWTTIAAIILDLTHLNDFKKKYKILSFASGTKCLAEYQLPTDGRFANAYIDKEQVNGIDTKKMSMSNTKKINNTSIFACLSMLFTICDEFFLKIATLHYKS